MWRSQDEEQEDDEVVSTRDTSQIKNLNEIPPSLFRWNLAAAIFQLVQAIVLFYLSSRATTDWYLYSNFPQTFDDRETNTEFGRPGAKEIAGYSVTWYSAVFILLSAIDHLSVITPGIRSIYERNIERSQNPFRWIEYSLSASLMRVMIAQLSGVTDIHLLFSIFCLAATTMILGWAHESVNAKARADGFKQNWFAFNAAFIPHLASWAVIFCYFFVSVSKADPPAFVWAIVFILFILDGTFALLFYLQWAMKGRFKDYVKGEIGFIVLSFTAKTLLAWLNFGGGAR